MTKNFIIVIFSLLSVSFSSMAVSPQDKSEKTQTKRNIPFETPYCECTFSTSKIYDDRHPPFLLWQFYRNGLLRSGNQFIPLKNIREEMGKKVGDDAFFEFANKDKKIDIKGHCKLISHCAADGKCFDIRYKGTVEMTEMGKTTKFPVWGGCGC